MKINNNRISFYCSEKEFEAIVLFADELNRMYNTKIIVNKCGSNVCLGVINAEAWVE